MPFHDRYYGDQSTGVWKYFPGGGNMCKAYDPRLRPWYSSAATGPNAPAAQPAKAAQQQQRAAQAEETGTTLAYGV